MMDYALEWNGYFIYKNPDGEDVMILTTNPEIKELETGVKYLTLDLALVRPFRNQDNEYSTDFIPVNFWYAQAERVYEYCGKGSVIGVQCRLSSRFVEREGVKYKSIEVNCERVSFIQLVAKNKDEIVPKNDME